MKTINEAEQRIFKEGVKRLLVSVEDLIPGIKRRPAKHGKGEYDQNSGNDFHNNFARTLLRTFREATGGEYSIYYEDSSRKDRLKEGFKDQVVVDLGAGGNLNGYCVAMIGHAKGYVSVDKFTGIADFFKHGLKSLRENLKRPYGPYDAPLIPVADIQDDMLTFLRRLPDNSVSIISSGIDGYVLPNHQYREEVRKEMARALSPKGLLVVNSGLTVDLEIASVIYDGEIQIYEKKADLSKD